MSQLARVKVGRWGLVGGHLLKCLFGGGGSEDFCGDVGSAMEMFLDKRYFLEFL